MAHRAPHRSIQRGLASARILGVVLVLIGSALLLLPDLDKNLRLVGGGAVLTGVVMVGMHFLRKLKSELMADGPLLEPAFRKPAHGAANFGSTTAHRTHIPATAPAGSDIPARAAEVIPPGHLPVPAATVWGQEVFDAMSSRQFEAVCEALFAQGGFGTRRHSHGAAGGVTIWLHSRHAQQGKDNPVAVAHCNQWQGQPVGVEEMRPLLELMESRQLKRGTCATSSSYTGNARKFARDNGINALDRAGLLTLIAGRTPVQQRSLLAIAHAGA